LCISLKYPHKADLLDMVTVRGNNNTGLMQVKCGGNFSSIVSVTVVHGERERVVSYPSPLFNKHFMKKIKRTKKEIYFSIDGNTLALGIAVLIFLYLVL